MELFRSRSPLELNFEVVSDYGHGCCLNGTGPGQVSDELKDDSTLVEYVSDFAEDDVRLDEIGRYLQSIFHLWSEVGGFERDRSFSDLDFSRGIDECRKWLGSNAELSKILDRTTYTIA